MKKIQGSPSKVNFLKYINIYRPRDYEKFNLIRKAGMQECFFSFFPEFPIQNVFKIQLHNCAITDSIGTVALRKAIGNFIRGREAS